jgi:ESF2/ABP1 family protein
MSSHDFQIPLPFIIMAENPDNGDHFHSAEEEEYDQETDQDERSGHEYEGFEEGMDRGGFIGDQSLKPLTPEALAAFRAAQSRAGIIYISRIPPGMQPAKVRHLMGAYGEVGRVYLQQEGISNSVCYSSIFHVS